MPAVISGVVALVASAIGIFAASKRQERQFANEIGQAAKRFQDELTLQEQRLKVELRTTFMAEEAIHGLLLDESFSQGRSFDQIKRRVGGFEDDELRKLLVRSGAIRYYRAPSLLPLMEGDTSWSMSGAG